MHGISRYAPGAEIAEQLGGLRHGDRPVAYLLSAGA
jgi:hypothetical protein